MLCFQGTLGDRIDGVEDGTKVEACNPMTLGNASSSLTGFTLLDGHIASVTTDSQTVANMDTNSVLAKPTSTALSAPTGTPASGDLEFGLGRNMMLLGSAGMVVVRFLSL
jgi:Family of unknown function (DUF6060)